MHTIEMGKEFKALTISSSAFAAASTIPSKYTCEGKDINPPLDIDHIPENVKSLVLMVDDPDAPRGTWLHWLVWDIPVTHHLAENKKPGVEGMNDFKRMHYGGPCPPTGTHRYFFRVYGLDCVLGLSAGASRGDLEKAMKDHILAYGELIGTYQRKN